MTSPNPPCFAAKEAVKNWPIAGKLNDALDTMYLSKGGSTAEERDKCISQIVERQNDIYKGKLFRSLCIFAEGTASNGHCLMPFKKGAFVSMLPVIPCYVKHTRVGVEMCGDSSTLPELS